MVRGWSVNHNKPGPRWKVPRLPYLEMLSLWGDLIQVFSSAAFAGVHSIHMTHDFPTIRCYCWGSEDEPFCGEDSTAWSGSIEASFGSGVVLGIRVSFMIKCRQMILCSLNGILFTYQPRKLYTINPCTDIAWVVY